jgi:hypothetical protein
MRIRYRNGDSFFFLCAALQPLLGEGMPFMLYYPAIVIAACSADYGKAFSPLS